MIKRYLLASLIFGLILQFITSVVLGQEVMNLYERSIPNCSKSLKLIKMLWSELFGRCEQWLTSNRITP